MTTESRNSEVRAGREGRLAPWMALGAAGGLLMVANGRDTLPVAAWLAPVFLLRFVRTGGRRALGLAWLMLIASWAFQFRGMVPAPQPLLATIWVAYGTAMTLPYLADRAMAPRLPAFASTLVFPCAAAGLDYLVSLLPYGSWASPAYSQAGNLPLMQIVSVTGIYGITFLLAWAAPVANLLWEHRGRLKPVRSAGTAWGLVLGGVLLWGSARLLEPVSEATVRVASLTAPDLVPSPSQKVIRKAMAGPLTPEECAEVRQWSEAVEANLLGRARKAAQAGARIVFWAEANSFALAQDEPAFLEKAAQTARQAGIYLGMGHAVIHPGEPHPLENAFILLGPTGKVLWTFLKAHPVPGGEAAISRRGDGRLPFAATPYGRLTTVICFDADSVQLLQQVGRGGADLLLIPANDWPAIAVRHAEMARFRGIEEGANTVRQVSGGLAQVTDTCGRILARASNVSDTAGKDLVAEVPIHGVRTLYGRFGDVFSWLALAGLGVLAVVALRRRSG